MESEEEGKDVAPLSDYGIRAATALHLIYPGRHRPKAVARALDVSLRMAKYLCAGRHWTVDRLSQAGRTIGTAPR